MNRRNLDRAGTAHPTLSRRDAFRALGFAGAALLFGRHLGAEEGPATAPLPPLPPTLTGSQPGYYRFRIGECEAVALSDGGMVAPLGRAWSGGTTEDEASALTGAAMSTERLELPFSVLLVRLGGELIMVDAGSGGLFGPFAGRLPASLSAAGIAPEQITGIVLTHAHGDHFGGLLDPVTHQPKFTHARLYIHRREYDYWSAENPDMSEMVVPEPQRRRVAASARECMLALKDRWAFVEPGTKLLDGLEILDAPGHTPGHIALLITSGNERLLHLADAVHHHAVSFAHPEWYYNFDTQPALARTTRKALLDRAAAERLRVFGAHLPFPGLGAVRKSGEHYEHILEPWSSLPLAAG